MSRSLIFLTRKGCHLCEEALALMSGTRVEVVDIDRDPDLQLLYDERVPVLLDPSGEVMLEGRFTEDRVRALAL